MCIIVTSYCTLAHLNNLIRVQIINVVCVSIGQQFYTAAQLIKCIVIAQYIDSCFDVLKVYMCILE